MQTFEMRKRLEALREDELRDTRPFSPDLAEATRAILAGQSDEERASTLGHWLTKYQPCIFVKVAAQRGLISYCFVSEDLIMRADAEIFGHIQLARGAWKSQAEDGRRSAFIVLAIGQRLASARPDQALLEFAVELASLYLGQTIKPDVIYHDRIRLWNVAYSERRRWRVGINFFGAQGDQRWWHDHRIPGGVGFSLNSVGHLVAAQVRLRAVQRAALAQAASGRGTKSLVRLKEAEANVARLQEMSIESLGHALKYAMHTIKGSSEGSSAHGGSSWERATMLVRSGPDSPCAIAEVIEDASLSLFNCSTYLGWYHTDITIPSEYFGGEQQRPSDIREPIALDFTYLHAGRGRDFRELAAGVKDKISTTDRRSRRRS